MEALSVTALAGLNYPPRRVATGRRKGSICANRTSGGSLGPLFYSYRPTTSVTLCPPNPNVLFIA